jgi:hypothetical protein
VVATPFGFTDPLRVALVLVIAVAALVVVVGDELSAISGRETVDGFLRADNDAVVAGAGQVCSSSTE